MDHAQIEERSIVLHRVIAQRIRENPALLDVARQNLRRWINEGGERPYWTAWEKLMEGPLEEMLAFMVSPTEKARWLRQSSPFAGIEFWDVAQPPPAVPIEQTGVPAPRFLELVFKRCGWPQTAMRS